ncbi:MAG: nucleotidyl transferase AbiEii/AbiGii toxin family protein [Hormoscilla sp. GUM202]|nr:nucleotidyl transferase AbiEii/AbiGii toxin family protein [Hormoscilla sp. GUM202]
MVLIADALSFQEFMNRESLPLATLHRAVFEFLRDRQDVVVFGAQAVNAYVGEPRMTQDIDVLSLQAASLAEELRSYLSERFYIAVRVRMVKGGKGYRLYQDRKKENRHLMDIRQVEMLPANRCIEQVLVMAPAELVVSKVISYHQRRGKPKAGTDWRDLAMLLLTFPELKVESGAVLDGLVAADVDESVVSLWREIVAMEIEASDEDDEF